MQKWKKGKIRKQKQRESEEKKYARETISKVVAQIVNGKINDGKENSHICWDKSKRKYVHNIHKVEEPANTEKKGTGEQTSKQLEKTTCNAENVTPTKKKKSLR